MATGWAARDIGITVKRLREERGWKVVNLAERTKETGAAIHRVALKKLEDGERDYVTVAELTGLAAALEISPLRLLFPNVLNDVEVLPGDERDGVFALGWFIGVAGVPASRPTIIFGEGDSTMEIAIRLVEIDKELRQEQHGLFTKERLLELRGGKSGQIVEGYRQRMARDIDHNIDRIEAIEKERARLVEVYKELLANESQRKADDPDA
ncbi:helix-turn-helix domain-containing protein [Mycobacteroides abscessus]|uniref:helix-turn-helix domain-containing protein n=1 Tax=Mycobacteroides abscessus TaxID=36809 RepID=UPI0011C43F84|nr:helix-turn-helix transcriptional regulator [Mycobacteroides abscessus]